MRSLANVIRKEIAEFASEQLPLIREGTPAAREELMARVEAFQNGVMDWWDEVMLALIKEGINAGEKMKLAPLMNEVMDVQLLDPVDIEKEIDWENRKTPFISEDPEILELLMTINYNTRPVPVAWTDGRKKYFMLATPVAAALATGDLALYRKMKETCSFFGDFPKMPTGDKSIWEEDPFSGIYKLDELRLRSPAEAAFLADDHDCIVEATSGLFDSRDLRAWATDGEGEMEYHIPFKAPLPEAMYWMDEENSRYVDGRYPGLANVYDIEVILETGNPVFLEHWLDMYDDISEETAEYMIKKVESLKVPELPAEALWELAKLKGVHCIPCDQEWLDERIKKCVSIIKIKMEA